ncbi:hypothetical protein JRF84_13985 [Methylobacterium organophilum]|jgi:hypothetical protein|uniref:hypothetical protein n=1 Tax=Methylobacterium organophilum TaxID=410 RepID=UPI0019CFEBAE|nr:hypothetical protein [Methylobacterium organophilum]MBN6820689.1 hypothetical protein [Methylobacterium organophilum]
MSATFAIDGARLVADGIERREQRRYGGSREDARKRVARKLGWSPGTLYNLARDRLKRLDGDLRRQLATYAIDDLENEIASLTAELAAARRLGASEDPALVRKVSAVLAEAQALHAQMCGAPHA